MRFSERSFKPAVFFAYLILGGHNFAHDPKLTTAVFRVSEEKILLTLTTPAASISTVLSNVEWNASTPASIFPEYLRRHLSLKSQSGMLRMECLRQTYLPDIRSFRYELSFTAPTRISQLSVFYDLYLDIPDVFENANIAQFQIGTYRSVGVFRPDNRTFDIPLARLLKEWGLSDEKNFRKNSP